MAAAAHGASFPLAKKLRATMAMSKLREFAKTKTKDLPEHAPNHPHKNLGKFLHAKKDQLADRVTSLRQGGAFR